MNFSSGLPAAGALLSVAKVVQAPAGTHPPDMALNQYWELNLATIEGALNVEIQFDIPAGIITSTELNDMSSLLARLDLFRRESGSTGDWSTIGNAIGATTGSITFSGINSFSEFTIGKSPVEDLEAPAVTNIAVTSSDPATIGEDVVVQANISDASTLTVKDLMWAAGSGNFENIDMELVSGDLYEATIDGEHVTLSGIVIKVHATDSHDNDTETALQTVPVQFRAGDLETDLSGSPYSSGVPSDRYVLISVPGDLDQTGVGTNFGDELGTSGADTWKMFKTVDEVASPATNIETGHGYWLQHRLGGTVPLAVGSGEVVDLVGHSITLTHGWNLIGNPFTDVLPVDFVQEEIYGPRAYAGTDWANGISNNMRPWEGYAVYNWSDNSVELTLQTASLGKEILAKAADPIDGWEVNLSLAGKTYSDRDNRLGRRADALEQRDKYDSPEPPFIDGYISLSMDRSEWAERYPAFTSDIRSTNVSEGTWEMALNTKGESGPIDVDFAIEGDVPSGTKIVLMDLTERSSYDLTAGEKPADITRYHEGYSYPLMMIAGSDSYVRNTVDEVIASLPEDFTLGSNYPNPFNPTTRVPYSVMRPAKVSLRVYNLIGQEIATLYNGWQDMGRYEATWNGLDKSGQPVASGLYIAVYRAEGKLDTQKMLMMK
jgi:hypothetical protein